MDDLREYFSACFGNTKGWLFAAFGSDPYLTESGKYEHRQWSERSWRYPQHADRVVRAIAEAAPSADVYVCPYLMKSRERAKGNAVSRVLVHADIDGALDECTVEALGGFAVSSGTPGHGHVYVPLAWPVTPAQHEVLCRGLAERLGGDAKFSDNDLLRPVGTLNHKPTVAGGIAAPVGLVAP